MELKVGDKVRFLNEKGGGIVTALLSTTMVQVAIEEGFEVPVLASELVKIEPGGMADRFFDRPSNVIVRQNGPSDSDSTRKTTPHSVVRPSEKQNIPDNEVDLITSIYKASGAGITEGIYLVWEPLDQKWLISGNINIYLINNTSLDAIYSFILEEESASYDGVSYEVIPPYSKIHIETITREDLEAWSNGIVQVMFFASEMPEVYRPLHAAFQVKSSRFYKETSYSEFQLTGSKVILLNLGDLVSQKFSSVSELDKLNIDPAAKQKVEAVSPKALIDRHKTGHREAEVDLHISALTPDYPKMPQNEILLYQIEYFMKMLESAIAYDYNKVVFIHGIGNGTLKAALINKLKDYENIELRRAKFEKYGNGAIEIIIH